MPNVQRVRDGQTGRNEQKAWSVRMLRDMLIVLVIQTMREPSVGRLLNRSKMKVQGLLPFLVKFWMGEQYLSPMGIQKHNANG